MDASQKIGALVEVGMPTRQATAYVYRELEDMSRLETAEKMDISPNTVDNLYSKAKTEVTNAVQMTQFIDREVGGVWEWVETLRETDHPDHDEVESDEFIEYWKNYPSVPGGR